MSYDFPRFQTTLAYQPGFDFSKFHTYRWVEINCVHPNPDVDAQIKHSVDSQLAKRKLIKTDNEAADLYVGYQVAIDKRTTWQTYKDWSSAALLEGRVPKPKEVTIDIGTLFVDLYNSAAKLLVWSGHASKALDANSSREQRAKNIDRAAQMLFENYPPR